MQVNQVRGYRPRPKIGEIRFVITEYRPQDEFPIAQEPISCPYLELDPSRPCRVVFHHLRLRKTGPVPAIVVCVCLVHGRGFSVYPHGAVPYSRVSWCPVGPGGEGLVVVEDAPPPEASRDLSPKVTGYVPTYPGAAVDEGRGVLWPTGAPWLDPPGNTHPRRETQVRRSLRTLRVLGMDSSEVDEGDRLRLSELLGIPMGRLLALEQGLLSNGRIEAPRARGEAACAAIEALPDVSPPCLAHRLAMAGYLAGVWGLPWGFDAERGTFTTEPFRRGGREVAVM